MKFWKLLPLLLSLMLALLVNSESLESQNAPMEELVMEDAGDNDYVGEEEEEEVAGEKGDKKDKKSPAKKRKPSKTMTIKGIAVSGKEYKILVIRSMPDRIAMKEAKKAAKKAGKNKEKDKKGPMELDNIPVGGMILLDGVAFQLRNVHLEKDDSKAGIKSLKSLKGEVVDVKMPVPEKGKKPDKEEMEKAHETMMKAKAAGDVNLFLDSKTFKGPMGNEHTHQVLRGEIKVSGASYQVFGIIPGGGPKKMAKKGGKQGK